MSEKRIEAFLALPFPTNTRELLTVLGTANYMRGFIPRYALLAKPLSSQLNVPPQQWNKAAMSSDFDILQRAIAEQISLSHLNYSVHIVIQFDASKLGVGACLINRYPYHDRVLGFFSYAFSERES